MFANTHMDAGVSVTVKSNNLECCTQKRSYVKVQRKHIWLERSPLFAKFERTCGDSGQLQNRLEQFMVRCYFGGLDSVALQKLF